MTREVAGTMVLQIVLVVAALAALFYFVRSGQNVGVRASKRLAFAGFVLISIYAVLRPNDVTWVARQLGIGRGTDLLVYLLVIGFIFGMLNTYLRDREISQHLTNLARQLAIRDAELARREDELAERLRDVAALAAAPEGTRHVGNGHGAGSDGAVPVPDGARSDRSSGDPASPAVEPAPEPESTPGSR